MTLRWLLLLATSALVSGQNSTATCPSAYSALTSLRMFIAHNGPPIVLHREILIHVSIENPILPSIDVCSAGKIKGQKIRVHRLR
jgi:hypothetical protein